MKNKLSFNNILIKEFNPSNGIVEKNEKESLKYHYTSPDAFVSIISNNEIHFTDIRYLNDKKEDVYLVELIKETIKDISEDCPLITQIIYETFVGNDEDWSFILGGEKIKFEKKRKFIFCTSTEADSLVMWNYYTNNNIYQGYNIGFNLEKFLKSFDTDREKEASPFLVLYGPVLYSKKEQKEEIKKHLLYFEKIAREHFESAKINLLHFIDTYSPYFKSKKFKHEKEYRFVIEIKEETLNKKSIIMESKSKMEPKKESQNNKKMKYKFKTKNGLVVPYLCVSIDKESVSSIYVSPITDFDLAKQSIKELLKIKDYINVKVLNSSVPIRF